MATASKTATKFVMLKSFSRGNKNIQAGDIIDAFRVIPAPNERIRPNAVYHYIKRGSRSRQAQKVSFILGVDIQPHVEKNRALGGGFFSKIKPYRPKPQHGRPVNLKVGTLKKVSNIGKVEKFVMLKSFSKGNKNLQAGSLIDAIRVIPKPNVRMRPAAVYTYIKRGSRSNQKQSVTFLLGVDIKPYYKVLHSPARPPVPVYGVPTGQSEGMPEIAEVLKTPLMTVPMEDSEALTSLNSTEPVETMESLETVESVETTQSDENEIMDTIKAAKDAGIEIVKEDIALIKEGGITATPIGVTIGSMVGMGIAHSKKAGMLGYVGYILVGAVLGAIGGHYYDKMEEDKVLAKAAAKDAGKPVPPVPNK